MGPETEAMNSARKSWGKFKGNTVKEEYDFFREGRKGLLTWEEAEPESSTYVHNTGSFRKRYTEDRFNHGMVHSAFCMSSREKTNELRVKLSCLRLILYI